MAEYAIAVKLVLDTDKPLTRAQRRALRVAIARAANGARWGADTPAVDVAAIVGQPITGSCYFAPTGEDDD